MPKKVHIIKNNGSWAVKTEDRGRVVSVHDTQKRAVEAGRDLARTKSTVLVIHGKDGRVSRRDYFLTDPVPPREPRKVLTPAVVNKKHAASIEKAVGSVLKNSPKPKTK